MKFILRAWPTFVGVLFFVSHPAPATTNSAERYWQITFASKFAKSDRSHDYWRTKIVAGKTEIYQGCDEKAKPMAVAETVPGGGWKLSGDFGDLNANIDRAGKLILRKGSEDYAKGQRIGLECESGIPKKITLIQAPGEAVLAELNGDAAKLINLANKTLPVTRVPALPALPVVQDSLTYLENGDAYACHTRPVNLESVRPLESVPTLGPIAGIWPGALIQGKYYASGKIAPISIPRKEGTTISITGVNLADKAKYSTQINGPASQASAEDAVRRILAQGVKSTEASSISFRTDIITNEDQLSYVLGVDGRFLNGIDKSLPVNTKNDRSYVLASFTQTYYIASVEDPEDPYSFFKDGQNFKVKGDQIGDDNLPLYVKTVSYGRLIYFLVSSPFEANLVVQALNSAHEGKDEAKVVSKGKSYSFSEILNGSTISFIALGGDALPALGHMGQMKSADNAYESFKKIITDQKLSEVTEFNKGIPIAYTLGYLANLATASLGYQTSYNQKECITTPKKNASFYAWISCIDDNAVVTLKNERTGNERLLTSGAGVPRFIDINSAIPDEEAKDNFIVRFRLYNVAGPSCLHFNVFRRRYGKINDFSAYNGYVYVPTGVDVTNSSPNWTFFPPAQLGGSWNVGWIVDYYTRINIDTGEGAYVGGG